MAGERGSPPPAADLSAARAVGGVAGPGRRSGEPHLLPHHDARPDHAGGSARRRCSGSWSGRRCCACPFCRARSGRCRWSGKTGEASARIPRALRRRKRTRRRSRNWRTEIFREPFDLVQGPLYRVEVLRRAADDHVLVFAIHHAIADGWTLGVFVQDLFARLHGDA